MTDLPQDAVGPIRLADGLGWGSAALGAPMVLTPRRLLGAIGVTPDPKPLAVTLAVGAREFLATATILGMRHRRVGAWSRVGGDLIDLTLLVTAFRTRRQNGWRLAGAMGLVGGILGLDAYTAVRLSRAEGTHIDDASSSHGHGAPMDDGGGPTRIRTAVTIRRSMEDVQREFRQFDWSAFEPESLERAGQVRFVDAPGERGVEVHVDYEPAVPAGAVGAAALKIAGQSPDQRTNDELRRFKAILETGVAPRSEKTPQGHSAFGQIFQRPAQPAGEPA